MIKATSLEEPAMIEERYPAVSEAGHVLFQLLMLMKPFSIFASFILIFLKLSIFLFLKTVTLKVW